MPNSRISTHCKITIYILPNIILDLANLDKEPQFHILFLKLVSTYLPVKVKKKTECLKQRGLHRVNLKNYMFC